MTDLDPHASTAAPDRESEAVKRAAELLCITLRDIADRLEEDVTFDRGEWVKTMPVNFGRKPRWPRTRGFVEGVTICRGVIADELRRVADWNQP